MEPVTFYNQTTRPPDYLSGRRFVPLGSSISNAPALTTPTRGYLFVWIYFKKSRRYHVSNLSPVIASFASPAGAWQSPSSTQPIPSRIPPPHTKRHHIFKTMIWTSFNRNRLVPLLFLKSPQINLSSCEAACSADNCSSIVLRNNSRSPRPSTMNHSLSHRLSTILFSLLSITHSPLTIIRLSTFDHSDHSDH